MDKKPHILLLPGVFLLAALLVALVPSSSAVLSAVTGSHTVKIPETIKLPALVTKVSARTSLPQGLSMKTKNTVNFELSITPAGTPSTGDFVNSNNAVGTKVSEVRFTSWGTGNLEYDTDPSTTEFVTEIEIKDQDEVRTVTITVQVEENLNDEKPDNLVVTELDGGDTTSFTYTVEEQTFPATDTNIFGLEIEDADWDDTISPITAKIFPTFDDKFGVTSPCTKKATDYPNYECNVFIKAGTALDYETQTEFVMKLTLSDTIGTVEQLLTVSVTNKLDEIPTFEDDNMPESIVITENENGVPITTEEVVYHVHGVNNEFDYDTADLNYEITNIADLTNSKNEPLFTIDATTGLIKRTTNELSFEDYDVADPTIVLNVRVFLVAEDTLESDKDLTITVLNICEAPVFKVTSQPFFRFDENEPTVDGDFWTAGGGSKKITPTGSAGYDLTVTDPDSPENGNSDSTGHLETITYTIAPSANDYLFRTVCDAGPPEVNTFDLSTVTGVFEATCSILWDSALDFEALDERPEFTIIIVATDSCGSTAEIPIEIGVRNENDNAPVFYDTGTFDATIREDAPRGTYVTTILAYDPDADPHETIQFSLRPEAPPDDTLPGNYWFQIVNTAEDTRFGTQNVGKLYVYYPWDRDRYGNLAVVRVWATDDKPWTEDPYTNGAESSTSIDVDIVITDVNDIRPITHTFWNREVPHEENAGFDMGVHLLSTVTSLQPNVLESIETSFDDQNANADTEFSFLQPSIYFQINSATGEITKLSYDLIVDDRYDVFVIGNDLGTDPVTHFTPMGVVRIDAYERKDIHVVFTMNVASTYFNTNKQNFINDMNTAYSAQGWFFRVHSVSGTNPIEVTLYALTSDITESVSKLNVTKTYVKKEDLLAVTRATSDGAPVTNFLTSPFDVYSIILVEPEYTEPVASENWWLDTEMGIVTIILIIFASLILLALLGYLLYLFITRERLPPPPKLPKPEPKPVFKQEYKETGPGPKIISNDDDDFIVARPPPRPLAKKPSGKQMRGWDAVTGREFNVDEVTGERHWPDNEGDFD